MWVLPRVQYQLHLFLRFRNKEQNDHCRAKIKQKQYWNWKSTKSNIPPCILVKYCERSNRLKFWIKGTILATFLGNIWARLKSVKIRILCCVGSSFINRIMPSINEPTGLGAHYTKTDLLSYFQSNWQHLYIVLGISITPMIFTSLTL